MSFHHYDRWYCDRCGTSASSYDDVYLDKYMNNGYDKAWVFCAYCDDQIGWIGFDEL